MQHISDVQCRPSADASASAGIGDVVDPAELATGADVVPLGQAAGGRVTVQPGVIALPCAGEPPPRRGAAVVVRHRRRVSRTRGRRRGRCAGRLVVPPLDRLRVEPGHEVVDEGLQVERGRIVFRHGSCGRHVSTVRHIPRVSSDPRALAETAPTAPDALSQRQVHSAGCAPGTANGPAVRRRRARSGQL